MKFALPLACICVLAFISSAAPADESKPRSLIRNGSFEGGGKYWLRNSGGWGDDPDARASGVYAEVAKDATAPHGQHVLVLKGGGVRTGAFEVEPGSKLVISCMAKADKADTPLSLRVTPSLDDRRDGVPPFGSRGKGTGFSAKVGVDWQRVSWTIDIPDAKWKWSGPGASFNWDHRTWVIMLSASKGAEIRLDAVSVVAGSDAGAYVPYAPVELLLTAPAVTAAGYRTNANIFDRNAKVILKAWAFCVDPQERDVTVRWELLSYDGEIVFQKADTKAKIEPLTPIELAHSVTLTGGGLMIARATVLDADGKVLARSDQPLTALAFPKKATKPDFRERFGGTVANGGRTRTVFLEDVAQKIGVAWTRWYPYTGWKDVQPTGPDAWVWPDEHFKGLYERGINVNAVLYGCPEWARAEGSKYIPKDMADWSADDKRWDDLSIETYWDKFIAESMKHYKDYSVAWELINEPEFSGGSLAGGGETGAAGARRWDARFYTNFVRRSYKRIKSIDKDAVVLISGVNGGIDPITKQFLTMGGAPYCDVYSFHTYGPGGVSSGPRIAAMYEAFRKAGAHDGFSIWFNEGWTTFPSSRDDPAAMLHGDRSAQAVADIVVRSLAASVHAGMDKFIAFNTAYPKHGRSFWDWSGDGTEWYDDDNNPTVAVGLFNTLIDQIGLSKPAAQFRVLSTAAPAGAVVLVFQDLRHDRGVAVIWVESGGEKPRPWQLSQQPGGTLELRVPDVFAMDVMGNPVAMESKDGASQLKLSRAGKPYFVYSSKGLSADQLAKALGMPDVTTAPAK
jgi:hypothetical protein